MKKAEVFLLIRSIIWNYLKYEKRCDLLILNFNNSLFGYCETCWGNKGLKSDLDF